MTEDQLRSAAGEIRLLCLDVDGVMTDGAMYYSPAGEAMKRFHTQDAAGIALARKAGVEIAWISADDSPITAARARKLEIVHVAFGCDDKVRAADLLRAQMQCQWRELAYMGDDWFDLPLLQRVGLSACPADAHPQVRAVVGYCCRASGGNGAVREFCDLLVGALAARRPAAR
jgi:3-deoxy-D-manno-octulosonate 8-phosphate phosphatase (KDO 8-P phosphatase)